MFIVITGPDGSGKSTACTMISKFLERFYGHNNVAVVSPWDVAPQLFSSRTSAREYLNTLDEPARALIILFGIQRTLDLARKKHPKVILFDSYWYKYVVSEIGRGESKAWLFDAVKIFPKPDLTFYLHVSPEEAASRKRVIKSYECGIKSGTASIEKFIHFQTTLQPIWKEVETYTGPWKHISSLLSPDKVVKQILDECTKEIA